MNIFASTDSARAAAAILSSSSDEDDIALLSHAEEDELGEFLMDTFISVDQI